MKQKRPEPNAIQKCERILAMFEDMFPRPYLVEPTQKSSSKHKRQHSVNPTRQPFSFLNKTNFEANRKQQSSNNQSGRKSISNVSFSSVYSKESRLDRIMKIKAGSGQKLAPRSKHDLNSSFSSGTSNFSNRSNKENQKRSNVSRLQRIMNLKVAKPQVASTLKHYRPYQSSKATPCKKEKSTVVEQIECRKELQRESRQKQRQDRLWSTFQRQRSLRLADEVRDSSKKHCHQRRVEKKVQSLVEKQVNRIRQDKQKELRKRKIFNDYLY